MLYTNKKTHCINGSKPKLTNERVTGIEPVSQPWEGRILPLNHTRIRANYLFKFPILPFIRRKQTLTLALI